MVEYFSKWIEFVVPPQNFVKLATATFLDRMLAHFGAPTKVLTDQGKEFLNFVEELCTKALINNCTTSQDHPEVDGLAKRAVQTTKHGLKKYGLIHGTYMKPNVVLDCYGLSI